MEKTCLDRVQVWGIFWQEDQLGTGRSNEASDGGAFVAAKVVHDNDVSGVQRREQDFFDIDLETLAIDRAVEYPRRINPIMAQGGHEGHCFPMSVRNLGFKPLTAWRPSSQRGHVCLGPCFIDEDQSIKCDLALVFFPLFSPASDIRSILFAGKYGFF